MNAAHERNDNRPTSIDQAGTFAYETPQAFRAALTAQFKAIAKTDPRYGVNELQRQFAYDRALARCFSAQDADRWILKGAGALLARLRQARHSLDIDLYFAAHAAAIAEATDALRQVLASDLGDHFQFEVSKIVSMADADMGARVHVTAMLGAKPFARFHIDVVVRTAMAGSPEVVAPLTPLNVPGLVRPSYRAFPLPDHLADKLMAITGTFEQAGKTNASSRVKDLVDIALIATSQAVDGTELRQAIHAGAAHRNRTPPGEFAVPDETTWRAIYPMSAKGAPPPVPSFADAIELARRLFNPALDGTPVKRWDPDERRWSR